MMLKSYPGSLLGTQFHASVNSVCEMLLDIRCKTLENAIGSDLLQCSHGNQVDGSHHVLPVYFERNI